MDRLVAHYADKIVAAGLAEPGTPVLGGLDAEAVWNREAPERAWLSTLFERLDISSVLYCRPAEPYRSLIQRLATGADGSIVPSDSETRTFLHEIPVSPAVELDPIVDALSRRKGVILPDGAIVTFGTVSPEQAFVTCSSIAFACFVKFFADLLSARRWGRPDARDLALAERVGEEIPLLPETPPALSVGPFATEEETYAALCEAGRWTVRLNLVDSYFGNISHLRDGVLYISQTGSSLDELEGCIDPVPLDGSACTAITASSEFSAHRKVVEAGAVRSILHGHPRFSVALSLDCPRRDCGPGIQCHLNCPHPRTVLDDVPVVPGEIGTGRHGIARTLPPALVEHDAAIVYGHGLFVTGPGDFRAPLARMLDIERRARREVFSRLLT